MNILLILPIVFPILAGVLLVLLKINSRKVSNVYVFVATLINSLLVFLALTLAANEALPLIHIYGKMNVILSVDTCGKIFAGLIACLWPLAVLYAFEYMKHEHKQNVFYCFYLLTYGITCGIAFSQNLLSVYFFYEFLTLVTLPLVMFGMSKKSIAAGIKYVIYSMGGAAFAFVGLMTVASFIGRTDFVFGGITQGATPEQKTILIATFVLASFGFGVKAALFPLHGWLPSASVAPTPVTALLHAVAVVNAGAFAIMRLIYFVYGPELLRGTYAQYILMTVAMVTILFGSGKAVKEQHFKRRLAYSTISNLSYIVFGFSIMTPMGLVGGMTHFVFHGVIKITLFFCAGAVLHQTEREYVDELYGLGKKMPAVFTIFTLASLCLIGVPPFTGFISKLNLLTAAADSGFKYAYAGIAVILISSLLTAIYAMSVSMKAFFPGEDFDHSINAQCKDPGWLMKLPMIILTVAALVLGFFAQPVIEILAGGIL